MFSEALLRSELGDKGEYSAAEVDSLCRVLERIEARPGPMLRDIRIWAGLLERPVEVDADGANGSAAAQEPPSEPAATEAAPAADEATPEPADGEAPEAAPAAEQG